MLDLSMFFLGKAVEIGYELGKKNYKSHNKNDFAEFEYMMSEIFSGPKIYFQTMQNVVGLIKQWFHRIE